jgi:hypothetical protein
LIEEQNQQEGIPIRAEEEEEEEEEVVVAP